MPFNDATRCAVCYLPGLVPHHPTGIPTPPATADYPPHTTRWRNTSGRCTVLYTFSAGRTPPTTPADAGRPTRLNCFVPATSRRGFAIYALLNTTTHCSGRSGIVDGDVSFRFGRPNTRTATHPPPTLLPFERGNQFMPGFPARRFPDDVILLVQHKHAGLYG